MGGGRRRHDAVASVSDGQDEAVEAGIAVDDGALAVERTPPLIRCRLSVDVVADLVRDAAREVARVAEALAVAVAELLGEQIERRLGEAWVLETLHRRDGIYIAGGKLVA